MKRTTNILLAFATAISAIASDPVMPRFGCEATDTLRLNEMLVSLDSQRISSPAARTAAAGLMMKGTPYGAHTLEGPVEQLTIRLDSLDCTTFVETALALAYTAGERRTSWRDFVYNLERFRYRGGKLNGYPSRLHYICDWAVDNIHRGNLRDVTDRVPNAVSVVRSIDFMTNHRDSYPALADSANFEAMKIVEQGFRLHKFPYVRTADLARRDVQNALQTGDVVALVTKMKDLDVTHMGMIVKDDAGVPHLLHASSSNGVVELSNVPLADFMRRNRSLMGIRVFRLAE